MKPMKIGEYFVEKQIAVGGQARIYEVFKNSQIFVIKVYNLIDEKENIFFNQEKQLMSLLQHEGILVPLEYRENETLIFMDQQIIKKNVVIMKYMRNGDLMNYIIKNGRLNQKVVLKLVRTIISCLKYLNSKDLYHGDLKPENVLLSQNYRPLLIDFGFILSASCVKQKESPKQYYIAPQVKKGMPYTQKSEAFSLGVLIFILAIGCLPFKQTKHTESTYRPLLQGKHQIFWKHFQQKLNFSLDPQLKNAIINLLEPNPKRRWNIQNLIQSEWFNNQVITQSEYLQYFQQKQYNNNRKYDKPYEFPFTDNEQTASKPSAFEEATEGDKPL